MMVRAVLAACVMIIGLTQVEWLGAEDIARLQAGVVKITAKPPSGTANVGTGFIVRVDKEAAYIVTAAHVVAGGDQQPKVEFFTKRNLPVTAEVVGLEGGDEVRGLALLIVRGAENIPKGIAALALTTSGRLLGGEDILVIGFPRNAGPWAVIKGNISSRQGRDIYFSPSIEAGHSGGPIFQGGKVVAVVGGADSQSVGRGVTVRSAQDYLEGFGITVQESVSITAPPVAFGESLQVTRIPQGQEIIGKDGAPMVLVPAGEFTMGSRQDGKMAEKDEWPAHQVYLDAYFIDQYEVTTSRYAKFFQETKRTAPVFWHEQVLTQHGGKPVVWVSWHDAQAYCAWAGKRLLTEAEWEKAARGIDQRLYPWGNAEPSQTLANFGYHDSMGYGVLTNFGSLEDGRSLYGAYDMAGNVWEWVADWYDSNYYGKSSVRNPKGPSAGEYRVLRGGSWFNGPRELRSAYRGRDTPLIRGAAIGFRCAQDVLQ